MTINQPQDTTKAKEAKDSKKTSVSEIAVLREQLSQKEAILQDYTNTLKRLQAEFENYMKRAEKERQDILKFANEKLIAKLLVVVDDFERAVGQMKKINVEDQVMQGIAMVGQELQNILASEGLKQIEAKGKQFDPYLHEVITCVDKNDCPENTVLEEIQKGYVLVNKPVRYSKVIISRQQKQQKQNEGEE